MTGIDEDGAKIIDWDDAWWPAINKTELAAFDSEPENEEDYDEDDAALERRGLSPGLIPSRLFKRVNGRKCGPKQYTSANASAAFIALIRHLNTGTKVRASNGSQLNSFRYSTAIPR